MHLSRVFALALVCACGSANSSTPPRPASQPTTPPSVTSAAPPQPEAPTNRIAFVHATVIDVTNGTAQPDRAVIVDGDDIAAVVASDAVPAKPRSRIIDARGKFIIPGLWDMHVHVADPMGAPGKLFVANGVTGVRVMWGNPRFAPGMERFHFDMRDRFEKGQDVGPRMVIASQMLEGPKPFRPQAIKLTTVDEAKKAVDDAKASGADFIKVYNTLTKPLFLAIADESKKVGLPFVGHVPDAVNAGDASDAGMKSEEHLMGILMACSSREAALRKKHLDFFAKDHPRAEQSKFERDETAALLASYDANRCGKLFAKFVANQTWQCPTLVLERVAAEYESLGNDPRLQYMSFFTKMIWSPRADPRFQGRTPEDAASLRASYQKDLALVGAMNQAHVPLLAGTDEFNPYTYPGFSLHDELGLLVKAGLTNAEALRTATLNPARFFGQESKRGTVSEGKVADLVVLDADPLVDIANTTKIDAVVLRGKLYDRAALDKLLEEAKAAASRRPTR